ncbi:hypothetical protein [Haloferula sp. A504]|uniref:hypothetical protein n=1 Tax=Haloferula sp. A504 TaxID=3373601 RepID=UPI0031C8DD67|nr:hypothetical protein [Verrucomicrobiaceae bacterium E54]
MQTTLRIDDEVYRRAKTKASELGLSLTRFFEEAVEERLGRLEEPPARRIELPTFGSGPPMSAAELRKRIEKAELEEDLKQLDGDGSSGQ